MQPRHATSIAACRQAPERCAVPRRSTMKSTDIFRRGGSRGPVLCVSGEIDLVVRDELRDALRRLVLDAHSPAYVDLSDVTFFDSTGVHALIDARAMAETRGVEL